MGKDVSKKPVDNSISTAAVLAALIVLGMEQKPLLNNVRRILLGKIEDLPGKFVSPFGQLLVTDEQVAEATALAKSATPLSHEELTGLATMAKVKPANVNKLSREPKFLAANLLYARDWAVKKNSGENTDTEGPAQFDWD